MEIPLSGNNADEQSPLDPRRLLRWIYLGRVAVATVSFGATLVGSLLVDPVSTVVATTLFVTAMALTASSIIQTEVKGRTPGPAFLYLQLMYDLLLITSVVHLSGGVASPFAALYILVMAAAALLLPIGSSLLLAMLGSVLYAGDAVALSGGDLSAYLVLQLVVFTLVAVGTGYIATQLQQAGEGRGRLQKELATMELRAADILENIRAGIITVDDAGRLLYANSEGADLLGFVLPQAIGSPILARIQAASPGMETALTEHIAGGLVTSRREGLLLREGAAVPLTITTTSVSGDLRDLGRATTAIFFDISDIKRFEEANLRAQRLEAVAELSASLAHEIKNPLASIQSAVEQLSHRPSASSDERTLSALVLRESEHLSRLLSEFLDFARVHVVRRESIDIGTAVRAAARLAEAHPDRGAQVGIVLDLPDGPLLIVADEDLLHQAFFNLILNAVQASPPQSEIRVRLRLLAEREQPKGRPSSGPAYSIEVRDSGGGIPAEISDRLFEPFATTRRGGSGLGLAVAHRAIAAHRGVILVDSTPSGSCFTVLIPVELTPLGAVS